MNQSLIKDKEIDKILSNVGIKREVNDIDDKKGKIKFEVPYSCLSRLRQKIGAKTINDESIRQTLRDFAINKIDKDYKKIPYDFSIQVPSIEIHKKTKNKQHYLEIICTLNWGTDNKTYFSVPYHPELQIILSEGLMAIDKLIIKAPNLCRFLKPHPTTVRLINKFEQTKKVRFLLKALENDFTPLLLAGIEEGKTMERSPIPQLIYKSVMSPKQFTYPNPMLYVGNNILARLKHEPIVQFLKKQIYDWELECCNPINQNDRNQAWKNLNKIKSIFEKKQIKFARNKGQKGRKIKSEVIREIINRHCLPEILTIIHSNLKMELANNLNRPYKGPNKWKNLKSDILKFASIHDIKLNKKDIVERRIKDNKNLALLLMACDIKCPFDTLEITFRKLPSLI